MTEDAKPKASKRGRPALSPEQRNRGIGLLAVVSPEVAAKVKAEADRRGCSYSHLARSFIERGLVELSENQAA